MRYKKILSRKGMLSQYPERTYMESDRGKGGTRPKPPKPLPKPPPPPPPPLTGCEFVSLGSLVGGVYTNDANIIYDPVNNSATAVLLKSTPDMNAMMAANVPLYGGSIWGLTGTNSKWGNIVTGCLVIIPQWGPFTWDTYVKFTVDPITPDIFFHSYYVPDPVTPPSSGGQGKGACAVSEFVDIWSGEILVAGPGGAEIYEITCHPTTSTWTDTLLFSLGPGQLGAGVSMTGDMVYRPSDNTIFILCWDNGTNQGGVRHYEYNGTLIDEAWFPVTFGVTYNSFSQTMYCYDGDVYFLRMGTIGLNQNAQDIFRVDENPLSFVVVANPPTFNSGLGGSTVTGADGATDSACCNQAPPPPNPCTDPTSPFGQMPYGYQEEWYHDPIDPNHNFWGDVILPQTPVVGGLTTPPFAPVGLTQTPGPIIASGTPFNQTQLHTLINASALNLLPIPSVLERSLMYEWQQTQPTLPYFPNPPYLHPSHVRMRNLTSHFDYENQATLCEWCADWDNGAGGPFNPQVLNWPLWNLQNPTWTVTEAEDMCDCCPATPPAGGWTALPLPPENQSGVRGEWIAW